MLKVKEVSFEEFAERTSVETSEADMAKWNEAYEEACKEFRSRTFENGYFSDLFFELKKALAEADITNDTAELDIGFKTSDEAFSGYVRGSTTSGLDVFVQSTKANSYSQTSVDRVIPDYDEVLRLIKFAVSVKYI